MTLEHGVRFSETLLAEVSGIAAEVAWYVLVMVR